MKPQLDTDTVLTIIKMIETRHSSDNAHYTNLLYDMYPSDEETKSYFRGKAEALDELKNHLQEYIEGLVTQAENQLNQ